MRLGRRSRRQQSSGNEMLDAVQEAIRHYRPSRPRPTGKLRAALARLRGAPRWLRLGVLLVLIANSVLIADGVRREGEETTARLEAVTGDVRVSRGGTASAVTATRGMVLHEDDVIYAASGGSATIVFPDGSAIRLEPDTRFEIRLLDYSRGSRRDRSFMLGYGSITARVSRFFGVDSETTIATPMAVVAARGTCFRLSYDPDTATTVLQVVEGVTEFLCGTVRISVSQGWTVVATGSRITSIQRTLPRPAALLSGIERSLRTYEVAPGSVKRWEFGIIYRLDPALQFIGIAPGRWSFAAVDAALRSRCIQALADLRTHIEGYGENAAPEYINPATLAELNLPDVERDRILNAFSGKMLIIYQRTAVNRYTAYARARDRNHTLYVMTERYVRRAE